MAQREWKSLSNLPWPQTFDVSKLLADSKNSIGDKLAEFRNHWACHEALARKCRFPSTSFRQRPKERPTQLISTRMKQRHAASNSVDIFKHFPRDFMTKHQPRTIIRDLGNKNARSTLTRASGKSDLSKN